MSRNEETRSGNELAMASLYYDLGNFSAFTPYVGAGIGFVLRDTKSQVRRERGLHGHGADLCRSIQLYTPVCAARGVKLPDDSHHGVQHRQADVGIGIAAR